MSYSHKLAKSQKLLDVHEWITSLMARPEAYNREEYHISLKKLILKSMMNWPLPQCFKMDGIK